MLPILDAVSDGLTSRYIITRLDCVMKRTARFVAAVKSLSISHSQTVKTRHPSPRRRRVTKWSLTLLWRSFGIQ